MKLRPLPQPVRALLASLEAPPRLVAHLTLVHDVAARLLNGVASKWPAAGVDREAVLLGAATHDIGKALHPEELSGPGKRHEEAGYQWLLQQGWPPERARFARTHGEARADLTLEDWLVILADKCWKGTRYEAAESTVAHLVAPGQPPWEVFMALDDIIGGIARDAERRLAWQASHPI